MNFKVESENLRKQAKLWAGRETAVGTVRTNVSPGFQRGADFGVMAGSMGVSEMYNTWTTSMSHALDDAEISFRYLDVSLRSAADAYDDSDTTTATSMAKLDKVLEEGDYHG